MVGRRPGDYRAPVYGSFLLVGAFFAFLVAVMPAEGGEHYYWEIMLPRSVLGLIVGYATQGYGRSPRARAA